VKDCKAVKTPMSEAGLRRAEPGKGALSGLYVSLTGALLYAVVVARPDIAYAVQNLGRHTQASEDEHWVAAKRVLRYLKGTSRLGILFRRDGKSEVQVTGYCDADWGGDTDTRRSTTGYTFSISGGPVSWSSRLQQSVALSSAEAEYTAVCAAVQEATYLRQLLADLGHKQEEPTVTFEDNQGCIALAENPVHHKRTKHIDIRYHFIRERVESGEVKLVCVPTKDQLADLLTKPVGGVRLEQLRGKLLGRE